MVELVAAPKMAYECRPRHLDKLFIYFDLPGIYHRGIVVARVLNVKKKHQGLAMLVSVDNNSKGLYAFKFQKMPMSKTTKVSVEICGDGRGLAP